MRRFVFFGLVAVLALGCVSKPVVAPRAVVPEVVPSEIRVSATAAKPFGDIVPVAVGISNGSDEEYIVHEERVFALDEAGRQIAPLPVEEAIRQAGGATALAAGLRGAGAGALMAGALGAATGAVVGAAGGKPGKGAAIGAGAGMATGALGGFFESKAKTEAETRQQIYALALGEKVLKPGLPVSGFVFFPKGNYTGIRVLALNAKTKAVEKITGPLMPAE
ncbi:MAG: hypothetical protein KatS3mg076_0830 [Candidatus Binatia bacterium]|nr:MAG: hypothetical protein KatS3mg076_0830 [Candidatus Binatia bacterium]